MVILKKKQNVKSIPLEVIKQYELRQELNNNCVYI